MNFSGVILAGGKSSRMGRDKAFLEIGGQSLLARQVKTLQMAGASEVFISGRANADYSAFAADVLLDKFPEAGPLAGIYSALKAAGNSLLLILAVDLVEMPAHFLSNMSNSISSSKGIIPRVAGKIEPLAAFYSCAAAEIAETNLREGQLTVRDFVRACVAANLATFANYTNEFLPLFKNLNRPTDLT